MKLEPVSQGLQCVVSVQSVFHKQRRSHMRETEGRGEPGDQALTMMREFMGRQLQSGHQGVLNDLGLLREMEVSWRV